MKQWWDKLQPRERLTLLIGGISLAVIVFVFAVWLPAHQNAEALRERVAEERATLAWMQQASRQVQAAGGTAPAPQNGNGQSLFALVESTARGAGLAENMRVESSGQRQVRVVLDGASFDQAVRWLAQLRSQHGVTASVAAFRRADAAGQVDAQLVLEGAQ